VVGRTMTFKPIHIPVSEACQCIGLHSKRIFVAMIKLKDLEMEKLSFMVWISSIKSQRK
jgi:hypothetical protein